MEYTNMVYDNRIGPTGRVPSLALELGREYHTQMERWGRLRERFPDIVDGAHIVHDEIMVPNTERGREFLKAYQTDFADMELKAFADAFAGVFAGPDISPDAIEIGERLFKEKTIGDLGRLAGSEASTPSVPRAPGRFQVGDKVRVVYCRGTMFGNPFRYARGDERVQLYEGIVTGLSEEKGHARVWCPLYPWAGESRQACMTKFAFRQQDGYRNTNDHGTGPTYIEPIETPYPGPPPWEQKKGHTQ